MIDASYRACRRACPEVPLTEDAVAFAIFEFAPLCRTVTVTNRERRKPSSF